MLVGRQLRSTRLVEILVEGFIARERLIARPLQDSRIYLLLLILVCIG